MNLTKATNWLDEKLQAYRLLNNDVVIGDVFEYFDGEDQQVLWAGTPPGEGDGLIFEFRGMYGFDSKKEAVDYIVSQVSP